LAHGVKVKDIYSKYDSVCIIYEDMSYTLFEGFYDSVTECDLTFGNLEAFGLVSDELISQHYSELSDISRQMTDKLYLEAATTHLKSAVTTLGKDGVRKLLDEI
jgi:hypothetical protein